LVLGGYDLLKPCAVMWSLIYYHSSVSCPTCLPVDIWVPCRPVGKNRSIFRNGI